jgi:Fur family transcriptional regulator, peroxide stress response regulator
VQQPVLNRKDLRQRISEAGLKATHQRIVIYEALQQLHGHPAAEDVFQLLKPANPSISLGTVYKSLDSFVEAGLIKRVLSAAGSRRYDTNCQPHSHIYCCNTNEIIDFTDPELEQLMQDFFSRKKLENFELASVFVQITGKKNDPGKDIVIRN